MWSLSKMQYIPNRRRQQEIANLIAIPSQQQPAVPILALNKGICRRQTQYRRRTICSLSIQHSIAQCNATKIMIINPRRNGHHQNTEQTDKRERLQNSTFDAAEFRNRRIGPLQRSTRRWSKRIECRERYRSNGSEHIDGVITTKPIWI